MINHMPIKVWNKITYQFSKHSHDNIFDLREEGSLQMGSYICH